MKYRLGFVSNSSSSSYCFYGKIIFSNWISDWLKSLGVDIPKEVERLGKINDYSVSVAIKKALELDNSFYCVYVSEQDSLYIGRVYSSIGDNETGKGFKHSVEELIGGGCKHIESEG